ncbi:MAG: hypothetical protein ACLP7P_17840 [Rhodomicrobium sp.]
MRALQIAVAIGGLVPASAGLAGIVLTPDLSGATAASLELDSNFRYLADCKALASGQRFKTT